MLQQIVFELLSGEPQGQPQDITMETSLRDLGIDSLRAITILYELEERFDIEIPNQVIEQISTVGDIVKYLDQVLQTTGSKCRATSSLPD